MSNKVIIKNKIKSFTKEINVSGDKSISIRWVLFSSLANGKSKATNLLMSEDVLAAINAIKILGIKVVIKKNECEIFGKGINGFKYKRNLKISAQLIIDMHNSYLESLNQVQKFQEKINILSKKVSKTTNFNESKIKEISSEVKILKDKLESCKNESDQKKQKLDEYKKHSSEDFYLKELRPLVMSTTTKTKPRHPWWHYIYNSCNDWRRAAQKQHIT